LVFAVAQALATDEETLREILGREIISPDLVLKEVEHFCDTRVPRMPAVNSVKEWEKHAKRLRRDVLKRIALRGQAAKWTRAKTKVEWLEAIDGGEGYTIKKLRYEAVPSLWIPALLYEPDGLNQKVPVVMNVNGHDGKGKATPYKQIRCINQAKRGMLALNVEWLGMGQLSKQNFQHYRMNQLDLCGTSGLAPFYLSMKRGLDVLLSHKFADSKRVGVAGLSGGGWQTIFISSIDTMATAADYTHLTALLAPRAALLTYNKKDNCCFASDHALEPLLEAAKPIYKLYGKEERLRWHVNEDPGTHNFELDNRQALYRLFADFFYTGDSKFCVEEIECEDEVLTADELRIELPDDSTDFNKLALQLSRKLPKKAQLPRTGRGAEQWRRKKVKLLREIVRARSYDVQAEKVTNEGINELQATLWKLKLDEEWTLPAVELSTRKSKKTAILVADDGYKNKATNIQQLLASGYRVLALDPFYVGGLKIPKRDFLFALLVAAVGERPLGLQASQLAAVSRWLHTDRKLGPVMLVASGEQLSLSALVAAVLEQHAIERVELTHALGSLKEVIERNDSVDKKPVFFCFGLLEYFDIRQLVAMVAPRQVWFSGASERAKEELKDLKDWYTTLGNEFDPLQ
jgi:hypothetical protein